MDHKVNYKVSFSFEVDGGIKDSREVILRGIEFRQIERQVKKYLGKEFGEVKWSDPLISKVEIFETEIV